MSVSTGENGTMEQRSEVRFSLVQWLLFLVFVIAVSR